MVFGWISIFGVKFHSNRKWLFVVAKKITLLFYLFLVEKEPILKLEKEAMCRKANPFMELVWHKYTHFMLFFTGYYWVIKLVPIWRLLCPFRVRLAACFNNIGLYKFKTLDFIFAFCFLFVTVLLFIKLIFCSCQWKRKPKVTSFHKCVILLIYWVRKVKYLNLFLACTCSCISTLANCLNHFKRQCQTSVFSGKLFMTSCTHFSFYPFLLFHIY